jgi:hypothetical protein
LADAFYRGTVAVSYSGKIGWLGRQDSNLGMAGSKPAALPLGYAPTEPYGFTYLKSVDCSSRQVEKTVETWVGCVHGVAAFILPNGILRGFAMPRLFASCIALLVFSGAGIVPGFALDPRLEAGLRNLEPSVRHEQRCDAEAMSRISRADKALRPDRVVAYAFGDTKTEGNTIHASGAAFRSRDGWFRLSYRCTTDDARMKIESFDFSIGAAVPEEQWEAHGLWG